MLESESGQQTKSQAADSDTTKFNVVAPPAVNLPKGGGALRGIGETFTTNPAMGSASATVPLGLSPGRNDFSPTISLTYDSSNGNGAFGFGWSLNVPSISRRTDRGIPQYLDAVESDTFMITGAEELVPVTDGSGERVIDRDSHAEFVVQRYRPRVERDFSRIERWTRKLNGDVHWRAFSPDNVLTIYGATENSRISHPEDRLAVYKWLICEARDDRGNAIIYEYKAEDAQGLELSLVSEHNRGQPDDTRRTVNRYLKRIRYGNLNTLLTASGERPVIVADSTVQSVHWLFEAVFDYGEHDDTPVETAPWGLRPDPISTYRSGFEIRTLRRCQRVLMFHHFPEEEGVGNDCLVRSTSFRYRDVSDDPSPYSFLESVRQSGFRRTDTGYVSRSFPDLEFGYSEVVLSETSEQTLDGGVQYLPQGIDGAQYRWQDLSNRGVDAVFAELGQAWYSWRNQSALNPDATARLAAPERIPVKPNALLANGARFTDVDGDGYLDLIPGDISDRGFFERSGESGWAAYRSFAQHLNVDLGAPDVRLIDITGNGLADILINEDEAFVWHQSLGEAGYGEAKRVAKLLDSETVPRQLTSQPGEAIYLADMCGDGLSDIVRITSRSVSYWPNLGYGRFGRRVQMDDVPNFDHDDRFDQARLRLADLDGSGTTDIVYLHAEGVHLYFNGSGNRWSTVRKVSALPLPDKLSDVGVYDLLGNGTACLVWSSGAPENERQGLSYVKLLGSVKPHLLSTIKNNLGAQTQVTYAPSTEFLLRDELHDKPWQGHLPFPVQVVKRKVVRDSVTGNEFISEFAYAHGHFDGQEREFRGWGFVERWDTERLAVFDGSAANNNASSWIPPVHTKTWYHTGLYHGRQHVSDYFAGSADERGEYFREPNRSGVSNLEWLLPDTVLPSDLTKDEAREACRALRGSMLRQEVYADDGSDKAEFPYTVVEQNFTVRLEQARGVQDHAVVFTHPRETLTFNYERIPVDPRVQHAITVDVDEYGNVVQELAIAYGRRIANRDLPLDTDRDRQACTHILMTEAAFTNAVETRDHFRTPLPSQTMAFEVTGLHPSGSQERFRFQEIQVALNDLAQTPMLDFADTPSLLSPQRRLIEQTRTRYRANDLQGLLPLHQLQYRGLSGESYQLVFSDALIQKVFVRDGINLLPDADVVLQGGGPARGGYKRMNGGTWMPSGREFYALETTVDELSEAVQSFFTPRRFRSPFHTASAPMDSVVDYDHYFLLPVQSTDALGNRTTVGERHANGTRNANVRGNDYRVLQPSAMMDANRNRSAVAFDALGMVVGTALMGKPGEAVGDSLDNFEPDLSLNVIDQHLDAPLGQNPLDVLGAASKRIIYRFADDANGSVRPTTLCTLVRETHHADTGNSSEVQHSFVYSDGLAREIQTKAVAERDAAGTPQWLVSGWQLVNNKGLPVREYEPFFSTLDPAVAHTFEPAKLTGVAKIVCYDPLQRVVATLYPNHTFEKTEFDAWQQRTWDTNDTVLLDPRLDQTVASFLFDSDGRPRMPVSEYLPTWHDLRSDSAHAAEFAQVFPDADDRAEETSAATKASVHAASPVTIHFDALSRPFLTLADNGPDPGTPGQRIHFATRSDHNVQGKVIGVRDGRTDINTTGRLTLVHDYDMAGRRIFQAAMDGGRAWMMLDIQGNAMANWDDRGHRTRMEYDQLRRVTHVWTRSSIGTPGAESLVEFSVYGEHHPEAGPRNLRGVLFLHCDQAGVFRNQSIDFKGNPREITRRIAAEFQTTMDWHPLANSLGGGTLGLSQLNQQLTSLCEPETYETATSYDALNRILTSTAADGSVTKNSYNESNLLTSVSVQQAGQPVLLDLITHVSYNARGQRKEIRYGNGVASRYEYAPETFRLTRLTTQRPAARFAGDCPNPQDPAWPGCGVQDLHYTYDPVGNIVSIRDRAQQGVYFLNQRVDPEMRFEYDPLYRLVEASGREHLGQVSTPSPHTHDDSSRMNVLQPGDGGALSRYIETYQYDAVGNLTSMSHHSAASPSSGWLRSYSYSNPGSLESGVVGNLLSTTTVEGNTTQFRYDAHGNTVHLPHLVAQANGESLRWNHNDRLVQAHLGGGGDVFYCYDSSGTRIRKVVRRLGGATEERLYLGDLEIFRRRNAAGSITFRRDTVHVRDGAHTVALLERKVFDGSGTDPSPDNLVRFQHGNHLGSASLELDMQAAILTYEEYSPFGNTVYHAVRAAVDTPKRYRYAGKERDEESGLNYFGQRYYACWLARWLQTDPKHSKLAEWSPYVYAVNNPIVMQDDDGQEPVHFEGSLSAGFGISFGTHENRMFFSLNASGGVSSGGPDADDRGAHARLQVGIKTFPHFSKWGRFDPEYQGWETQLTAGGELGDDGSLTVGWKSTWHFAKSFSEMRSSPVTSGDRLSQTNQRLGEITLRFGSTLKNNTVISIVNDTALVGGDGGDSFRSARVRVVNNSALRWNGQSYTRHTIGLELDLITGLVRPRDGEGLVNKQGPGKYGEYIMNGPFKDLSQGKLALILGQTELELHPSGGSAAIKNYQLQLGADAEFIRDWTQNRLIHDLIVKMPRVPLQDRPFRLYTNGEISTSAEANSDFFRLRPNNE